MAKTPLNETVDKFFKKYGNKPITKEIVASAKLDIKLTNEYGNLLHAIVNYHYPENRVLELISILLDMGIDVNAIGKNTGLSFIHLCLYGYTDDKNVDHSYSTDFIIKLIDMALNHGMNANIKDSDGETIAEAAMASEVYTGKIIPIISSLGPTFEINESIEEKYNYYLKNSNGAWHKRLASEEKELRDLIKKSKFNPTLVKEELDNGLKEVNQATNQLTYESLKQNYQNINNLINNLKSLINKSSDYEIDTKPYQDFLNNLLNNIIIPILSSELDTLEKSPSDKEINIIKEIITLFAFTSLLKRLEEIASNYEIYKNDLKTSANNVGCLEEINAFMESLASKESLINHELYDELMSIAKEKSAALHNLITTIKNVLENNKKIKEQIQSYVEVTKEDIDYEYSKLESDELKEILNREEKEQDTLHQTILDYVFHEYAKLNETLKPLIASNILSNDDLLASFSKTLNKPKSKGKKKIDE